MKNKTSLGISWKTFSLMLFIVGLGTYLRLIFINKPDGLWNDEYVSWAISSIPLGKAFIDAISFQCHMPLYYLYLKFFIHFFGNSDLMLRLTSVLPGILSIISMYFVGRELKDSKLGILCASITALSSFSIYFSQEVRFYELLFFFSSLSLLFTLKLVKKQSLLNFALLILSSFLIIFTHTIGFIFVFFNLILLSNRLIKIDKKYKKSLIITWGIISAIILANIPLFYKIFTTHPLSQWWGHFTFSKLGFLITDYFSPILTNLVSAPDNFFYNFSLGFVIFAIIPSAIAIAGIIKALKEEKRTSKDKSFSSSLFPLSYLFYVCLAFLLTLVIMAIAGKLMFITKYSMEIYPILITIMAYGLLEFKKSWRYFLIFAFCFLNLFYILSNKNSAPKMHRSEGHKLVAELIGNAKLKSNDYILLNYYSQDRFEKYFDFKKYNVVSFNKNNFLQNLGIQSKEDLRTVDTKYFDKKLKTEVLSKLKPNQKLSVVLLKDVALYSPMQMDALVNDDKAYKKTPFFFLVFSQFKNEILKNCLKDLRILRIEEKGSWVVVTFVKK